MGIHLGPTNLASLKQLRIRLCFFDVDGTLIGTSGQISKRTADSISRFREQGGLIAIASGRPAFSAQNIMKQLGINAPSVFFSGALVLDPKSGSSLRSQALPAQTIRAVREYALKHALHLEYYTSESYFVEIPSHFGEIHAHYIHRLPTTASFESILAQSAILKLVLMSDNEKDATALRNIDESVPEISLGVSYGANHAQVTFGNITSSTSSRDAAFDFILERLNLTSSEIASFGDGESDLPFLLRSGLGVAMGNAPQAVREKAPFVVNSVDEDGVAVVMEALSASSS
ncbi:MAG: Cof-type HAD-IIB family hydrolase [Oligoflexia bacterium]|nr:Cof-type HAD-IIB family hydrolase [Oligoflexia bacterium]